MGWNSDESISVNPPAAPAADATVVLINTATMFANTKKSIALMGLSRAVVTFNSVSHVSAAAGLKAYSSSDGGTNWDQIEPGETIPVSAGSDVAAHEFPIDIYDDFKWEYTAGAVGPTTWRVTIKLVCGQRAVAT